MAKFTTLYNADLDTHWECPNGAVEAQAKNGWVPVTDDSHTGYSDLELDFDPESNPSDYDEGES